MNGGLEIFRSIADSNPLPFNKFFETSKGLSAHDCLMMKPHLQAEHSGVMVIGYRCSVNVFVSEPDTDIYNAMNKGIQRATGDYILFLKSDDYFAEDQFLSNVADHMGKIGSDDFLYGRIVARKSANEFQQVEPPAVPGILHHMICGCLPHQASFARIDLFQRIGSFDERYRVHAEYDWFLRLATAPGLNIAQYPRNASVYHEAGLSSNLRVGQPEAYAIQNQLPVYQEECWMRERLRIYQERVLDLRVHSAKLERSFREWQSSKLFKLREMDGVQASNPPDAELVESENSGNHRPPYPPPEESCETLF